MVKDQLAYHCGCCVGQDAVSGSRSQASGALHREPSLDRSANLSLSNIRHTLIRQEDTIIYSILERAQVDPSTTVSMPLFVLPNHMYFIFPHPPLMKCPSDGQHEVWCRFRAAHWYRILTNQSATTKSLPCRYKPHHCLDMRSSPLFHLEGYSTNRTMLLGCCVEALVRRGWRRYSGVQKHLLHHFAPAKRAETQGEVTSREQEA